MSSSAGSCTSDDMFCWTMSLWRHVLLDHVPLMTCSAGSCPSHDMFCWIMSLSWHVLLDHVPLNSCSAGSCPSEDMFWWIMSFWRHVLQDHVPLNWSIGMACSLKKGCEIAVKCLLKTIQTSWVFQGALLLGPTLHPWAPNVETAHTSPMPHFYPSPGPLSAIAPSWSPPPSRILIWGFPDVSAFTFASAVDCYFWRELVFPKHVFVPEAE